MGWTASQAIYIQASIIYTSLLSRYNTWTTIQQPYGWTICRLAIFAQIMFLYVSDD